ncbi:metalloregulator ArsR/SmtB family transcription factor [Nitrospinae bacterium AH_259_B05_G02_I21]|nr:metalloregulator ArsR/SmtB family transcription factor [Nitrospinae bacterium AH_259_B05_G02_I21]
MSNQSRMFKDQLYEQFARIGKALASPKRLELLDLLAQGERRVESLANEASTSLANCSQHLQVLREARLVEARKEGLYVFYRLADEAVSGFWLALRSLAERRLADVERVVRDYFEAPEELEPVGHDELLGRVRHSSVTVLDVRPVEEYRAGHIPGAVSVPLEELERRLSELPRDQEVIAYCRGPYCVFAVHAVELLRKRGFTAYRFEEGIPEWRLAGLPVAVGEE